MRTAVISLPQGQVWACPTVRHFEGKIEGGCEVVEFGTKVKLLSTVPGGFSGYALIEYETTPGQAKRGYVPRIAVQIE